MFGLLKDKLKKAVSIFTRKVETEAKEEVKEEVIEIPKPIPKKEAKVEPVKEKAEKKPEKKAEKPKKVEKAEQKLKVPPKKVEEKLKEEEIIKLEEPKEVIEKPKEALEIPKEVLKEEKRSFFERLKEKFVKKEEKIEEAAEKPKEAIKEIKEEPKPLVKEEILPKEEVKELPKEIPKEKKGFFDIIKEKIVTKKIDEKQFDEMFWDLELAMLESNVAVEVIDKIKSDLKKEIIDVPIKKSEIENVIIRSLKRSINGLFDVPEIDLIKNAREKKEKPYVVIFVGVNGAGKTTTIAKVARLLLDNKLSCVLVAADTWRAASIEQLEHHGKNLGVKVVKHNYGSDPAAVAYDGIAMAKARGIDVVLIDTAGRQHSNTNLIAEMEKIVRVTKPDLKLFIGESITGNDCVEQMKKFNESIKIDGAILSKADIDEKGGAAISISYVSRKPILYLGIGQGLTDLEPFDKDKIIKSIGL